MRIVQNATEQFEDNINIYWLQLYPSSKEIRHKKYNKEACDRMATLVFTK